MCFIFTRAVRVLHSFFYYYNYVHKIVIYQHWTNPKDENLCFDVYVAVQNQLGSIQKYRLCDVNSLMSIKLVFPLC